MCASACLPSLHVGVFVEFCMGVWGCGLWCAVLWMHHDACVKLLNVNVPLALMVTLSQLTSPTTSLSSTHSLPGLSYCFLWSSHACLQLAFFLCCGTAYNFSHLFANTGTTHCEDGPALTLSLTYTGFPHTSIPIQVSNPTKPLSPPLQQHTNILGPSPVVLPLDLAHHQEAYSCIRCNRQHCSRHSNHKHLGNFFM